MKIADALGSIFTLGLDTAPLIYFVEKHPTYYPLALSIFQTITASRVQGISSVITLTEVLSHPLKLGNITIAVQYEDILLNSIGFKVIDIDVSIAREAAHLRAKYNLRTPDALQVATAIQTGCQAFLTNDKGLKRVTELPILVLEELEI